ncbi:MAG: class I SAM-dependent methyltransferase, partial [Bacteroidota bacterium]
MSCPNCRTAGTLTPLSRVDDVPVHSVLLVSSEDEAASFPVGQIDLQACSYCGFVTNVAFEPEVMAYSTRYEETQGYSPTFSRFHRRLAEELIERYDLREKHVLEIGCGKGDFVTLLKQLGNNTGIGFDPAYVPERNPYDGEEGLTFVQDLYDERYTDVQADFVCCKMTLEHIREPAAFMETVRRAIGDRTDTVVFFQIPDTERILRDIAFWDVYYEHCSYFSKASLDYLFRATGFHVLNTWTDYDDQYLMIEALPNGVVHAPCPPDLEHFGFELHRFRRLLPERL